MIFKKKFLNIKYLLWFSLQPLPKIFIARRTDRDMMNVLMYSCKVPDKLVRFKSILNFLNRVSKNTQVSNFKKSVHWESSCSMWTEEQTDEQT